MREMRRKDRQTTQERAWEIMDHCDYAVLSVTAENGEPYGVPLSIVRSGTAVYFHCAKEGKKVDILRKSPGVCLTCVGKNRLDPEHFTVRYESAIAFGRAEEVTDPAEKREAMRLLCLRYAPDHMTGFEKALGADMHHTAVWKIVVNTITGKNSG